MSKSDRVTSLSGGTPIEDDEPIEQKPLVHRPVEASSEPAAPEEKGREGIQLAPPKPQASTGIVLNANVARLAERFKPEDDKKSVCFRLSPWLVRMINQHVFELKGQGSKITKEALAEDAFMKYFGLKAPPQQ